MGVSKADPDEYIQLYGNTLTAPNELPQYVLDIELPNDLSLAAEKPAKHVYELEGDLEALKLIDLEKEGLGEYREQLERLGTFYNSLFAQKLFFFYIDVYSKVF